MKTVFLDRDGVINENLDNSYVKSWNEFKFIPGAKEAIKKLNEASWNIIVITNQACIGRGLVSAHAIEEINKLMIYEIEHFGGEIKAIYHCPHSPEEHCVCRKPRPGMLLQASNEFDINLTKSYLIGDKISDIQAGIKVGCKTLLVKTGLGERELQKINQCAVSPDFIVTDITEAVDLILNFPVL